MCHTAEHRVAGNYYHMTVDLLLRLFYQMELRGLTGGEEKTPMFYLMPMFQSGEVSNAPV
jgi:hypothetical protein